MNTLISVVIPTYNRKHLVEIELVNLKRGVGVTLAKSILGGVPLTSPEGLRNAVDFFGSVYATTINSFCIVEGVQPPRPNVFIGSKILHQ